MKKIQHTNTHIHKKTQASCKQEEGGRKFPFRPSNDASVIYRVFAMVTSSVYNFCQQFSNWGGGASIKHVKCKKKKRK